MRIVLWQLPAVAAISLLVWLLLPFLDRSGSERVRAFITGLGVFALIYISTMTVYGHFAK